ncbi:MAG TPA: hypothetical protein VLC94_01250 [Candidatus Acidoferrum sp.]|nr:hypothetical protein [Candidatus Acidoferrum sp.]
MATSPALSTRVRDRRFYLFIAIVAAALVFAGFARTFYLNGFFARMHLPSLFIIHGVVFSSWLVVLVAQTALVSARQIRIHQKLGYASIVIVVGMLVLGWIMSVQAAQRGFTPPGGPPPLAFLAFQLFGLAAFIGLVTAAYLLRNRPETHKRLMIGATILIMTPAVARIFLLYTTNAVLPKTLAVQFVLYLACMSYDLFTRKRVHVAYLWSVAAFLLFVFGAIFGGMTRPWLAIAHWITGV